MDTLASKFCFVLWILIINFCSSSGSILSTSKYKHDQRQLTQTTQHDFMQPPITTLPTPLTNPVTTPSTGTLPPVFSMPAPIITVPSTNPADPSTLPPAVEYPVIPSVPVTNPVTTPSTAIPVGPQPNPDTTPRTTVPVSTQPVTNPVTTYQPPATGNDPTTTPAVEAPSGTATTNSPAVLGQSWCVVKNGAADTVVQAALDYACGFGADCSGIQQGASCYNPNNLQNHASYAFNSYYQRNPTQSSCDFGGAAMLTSVNPSSGSCIFKTGSSSTTPSPTPPTPLPPPTTASPLTTTTTPAPTTESSSGTTLAPPGLVTFPTVFNESSPSLGGGITGGYGESPPTVNISSASSRPDICQPFIGCIIVVTTIITRF